MTNEKFINSLIVKYPYFKDFNYEKNMLFYNNKKVDLNNINLDHFFRKNVKLSNNLGSLSDDVFNIILWHCMKKGQSLLNIDESILIKGLRILKHENSDGLIDDYVYIIDNLGNTYITQCDLANKVFKYYNEEINKNFNQVTVYMINKYLSQFQNESYFKKFQNDLNNGLVNKEYILLMIKMYRLKDYLMPYLLEDLNIFINYILGLEVKEDLNSNEDMILKLFKDSNVLKRQNGYLNGYLIIALVIILGIFLGMLFLKVGYR